MGKITDLINSINEGNIDFKKLTDYPDNKLPKELLDTLKGIQKGKFKWNTTNTYADDKPLVYRVFFSRDYLNFSNADMQKLVSNPNFVGLFIDKDDLISLNFKV